MVRDVLSLLKAVVAFFEGVLEFVGGVFGFVGGAVELGVMELSFASRDLELVMKVLRREARFSLCLES